MIAYHFVGKTLRDGRPIPPDGEWLEHDGPLVMCESGLHASTHPFDALEYAPGDTLCLVELGGNMQTEGDRSVATRRRIIKRIDAEPLLRAFARQQALSVIHLWDAPDVVVKYLKTGDDTLRSAASEAAMAAARSAAMSDAMAAAWDAGLPDAMATTISFTRSAASSDARSAASSDARSAASSAAWDAAWAASRSLARDAASFSARAATRSDARSAARDQFKVIVDREMSR